MSKKKKNSKKSGKSIKLNKPINLSEILPPIKRVNVSRYTFEAWMKSYPESNRAEWELRAFPDSIADFITNAMDEMGTIASDVDIVNVVALGDDYFKWLEENNLNNDREKRLEYINSISDDEAQLLWNKNGMNREYGLYGLPVAAVGVDIKNKTTQFALTDEKRHSIKRFFEMIFGKGNVWVSKAMLKPTIFYSNVDLLQNVGQQQLAAKDSNAELCLSLFDQQTYMSNEVNVANFYIPVVIARDVKRCMFDLYDFEDNIDSYYPEDTEFDKEHPVFKKPLSLENVVEAHIVPSLTHWSEIPDVEEECINGMKREFKKIGLPVTLIKEDN